MPQLTVETCYQLAVEHAEQAAGFDVVIFADAAINGPEPFDWKRIEPQMTIAFSTHHVSPETILGLAQSVFESEGGGFYARDSRLRVRRFRRTSLAASTSRIWQRPCSISNRSLRETCCRTR